MHFYTYDEWLNNAYYYLDKDALAVSGQKVFDISSGSKEISGSTTLSIKSCWKNPNFVSTYSGGYADVAPTMNPIECDVGCLYEFNNGVLYDDGSDLNPESSTYARNRWNDTTRSNFLKNRGCIQPLSNIDDPNKEDTDVSGNYGSFSTPPYIELSKETTYSSFNEYNEKTLKINLEACRTIMNRILIFQSIYSGAISFQSMSSYLDFKFDKTQTNYGYDFRIHTNLYSSDSLMIVGALLTFGSAEYKESQSSSVSKRYYLTVENVSKFVYGHVDMDKQYNWNMLWDTFKPASTSKVLDSSIMHKTKR